jgi:peptidoglycan/xylan/chitin deacetylase (PgdA/CDA1 family)
MNQFSALFYHGLRTRPLAHVDPLYASKDAAQFEQDLALLSAEHRPVSHEDVVAARERRAALPPRAVSLSFDDGFTECFSVARPLLLKYRVPCTFFVIRNAVGNASLMHRNQIALCLSALADPARDASADLAAIGKACGVSMSTREDARRWTRGLRFRDREQIARVCDALAIDVYAFLRDQRPYMTEAEVRELHADGFTIGAHTDDHPELADLSYAEMRAQVESSCAFVRGITGHDRVPFAIPFNGLELRRSDLARLRVDAGIDLVYDTNNLMRDRDFIVNRIWCDSPSGASAGRSNLPWLLRRARACEPFRRIKRRMNGLPR